MKKTSWLFSVHSLSVLLTIALLIVSLPISCFALAPDGSGVTYTYDAIGNLLQALPADLTEREYEVQVGDDIYETHVEYGYAADEASASVAYTYDAANRLSTVTTESTTYTFTYDAFGNSASIQAGSATLASYTYNANNGKIATMTYGNGLIVQYTYDILDRISQICYNALGEDFETIFVPVYSYEYTRGRRFPMPKGATC